MNIDRAPLNSTSVRLRSRVVIRLVAPDEFGTGLEVAPETRYRVEPTRILCEEKPDASTNAPERALLPAAVIRKLTAGAGAGTVPRPGAKLTSLSRTADQRKPGAYAATQTLIRQYWQSLGR